MHEILTDSSGLVVSCLYMAIILHTVTPDCSYIRCRAHETEYSTFCRCTELSNPASVQEQCSLFIIKKLLSLPQITSDSVFWSGHRPYSVHICRPWPNSHFSWQWAKHEVISEIWSEYHWRTLNTLWNCKLSVLLLPLLTLLLLIILLLLLYSNSQHRWLMVPSIIYI